MRAMTVCINCGRDVPDKAAFCSQCGTSQRENTPVQTGTAAAGHTLRAWGRREYVALAGVALVTFGSFSPVVTSPVDGTLTYINNGHGDGMLSLIFAFAVLLLVVFNLVRWTWIVGVLAAAVVVFDLVNLSSSIPGTASTSQLGYGWALLVIGAVLMTVASFLPDASPSP